MTPNMPQSAGLRRFFYREYSSASESGILDLGSFAITPNASAPHSGPLVSRAFYPAGSRGEWSDPNGTESTSAEKGGAGQYSGDSNRWKRMYMATWFSLSPTYSIHTNGEKFFYPLRQRVADNDPSRFYTTFLGLELPYDPLQPLATEAARAGAANGQFMYIREGVSGCGGGDDSRFYGNTGASPNFTKGEFHLLEVYMVINDGTSPNGVVQWWIDGRLVGNYTNMVFTCGESYFSTFRMTGTRGGGYSEAPVPPEGQYRDFDSMVFFVSEQ